VSLDQLSAQQLTAVKKQLDEEVEHLTTSFAQLQAAQIKFKDCLRCVQTQGSTQGEWITGGSGQMFPFTTHHAESRSNNRQETNFGTPDKLFVCQRQHLKP
jgi:hypothetical protein